MQFAVSLLSVVPIRKEPSHRSEMVSQLLFGEFVQVVDEKEDFVAVTCMSDDYSGWVQRSQLRACTAPLTAKAYTNSFSTIVSVGNQLMHVPYAAPVFNENGARMEIGGTTVQFLLKPQQLWQEGQLSLTAESLAAVCQPYLGAPYLWGGRSVFGTDCSGFVQQVMKFFGKKLMRDAYLQAEQGQAVASLAEAKFGDLIFFQNDAGRIMHVGIFLQDGKIIHASGEVRIDDMKNGGIINSLTGKLTHRFHSIRRMA